MYVYQEKAIDRIKKGLRRMNGIVERAIRDDYKEADTRKIVSDMLSEYLGWDKFENVTAEQMIGSRYADYVVKTSDENVFVIEVKQIGLKLKETHLNQARQYAVDEGIDWVILTNGDEWQAYRTELEGKIPVQACVHRQAIRRRHETRREGSPVLLILRRSESQKGDRRLLSAAHCAVWREPRRPYTVRRCDEQASRLHQECHWAAVDQFGNSFGIAQTAVPQ